MAPPPASTRPLAIAFATLGLATACVLVDAEPMRSGASAPGLLMWPTAMAGAATLIARQRSIHHAMLVTIMVGWGCGLATVLLLPRPLAIGTSLALLALVWPVAL